MSKPSLKAPKNTNKPPKAVMKLVSEAQEIMERLEAVKTLYGRLDELTLELMSADLSATPLEVVDNFVDKEGKPKNVAWKASGIRRFELKVRK
jgi:predicted S18 family serine protease